ncbi:hypothetical protein GQ457_09G025350 [Hibiscus cannabinus]
MWSKVAVKASFTNEVEWWTNPAGCLSSVVSSYPLLDSCPAFRVSGVKLGNKADRRTLLICCSFFLRCSTVCLDSVAEIGQFISNTWK